MDKKMEKKKDEEKTIDKSQEPFDYAHIEELRRKAWADPEVKKNWEEFDRKQREKK